MCPLKKANILLLIRRIRASRLYQKLRMAGLVDALGALGRIFLVVSVFSLIGYLVTPYGYDILLGLVVVLLVVPMTRLGHKSRGEKVYEGARWLLRGWHGNVFFSLLVALFIVVFIMWERDARHHPGRLWVHLVYGGSVVLIILAMVWLWGHPLP